MRNKLIMAVICVAVLGLGVFMFVAFRRGGESLPELGISLPTSTEPAALKNNLPEYKVIGSSIEGRKIEAYMYGSGKTHLAFVGGIHGGYEWNSVLLAYELMDYLKANPAVIPANLTVTVIPSANPDGVYKVIRKEGRFTAADAPVGAAAEPGRFNAREVDINRNFDCKWKPMGTWKGNTVSAGSAPFSEPETRAIRDFVYKNSPAAVVFWHSKANAVYASECENGILPETLKIMGAYSRASGYPAVDSFDAYEVTGDAEGWLASTGVPAITVELKTHETVEWERNLAGVKALFEYYKNKTE